MRYCLSVGILWTYPLIAACGSGSGTITGLKVVDQTQRQLLIKFSVPHANNAFVDVFTDSACTHEVNDTLASPQANKVGAVIDGVLSNGSTDGQVVLFPVGSLVANSALTQNTQYWVQITNSGDSSTLTIQAGTAPFKTGNMYPEQPLPDPNRWDGRTYPTGNFTNRNALFTDPTTGLLAKMFTMPGDAWSQSYGVGDNYSCTAVNLSGVPWCKLDTPITSSGTWTNPNNTVSIYNVNQYPTAPSGGGFPYGTCTGVCDIWFPMPNVQASLLNGVTGSTWSAGTLSAYSAGYSWDEIIPYVWASVSSGSPTMVVSITQTPTGSAYHGCSFTTGGLTSTPTGYRSTDPDPGFTTLCPGSPPLHGDIVSSQGTYSVSGTQVTRLTGDYFQATWPVGGLIELSGVGYPIASVNSPSSITLQSSLPVASGAYNSSRMIGIRVQVNVGAATLSIQVGYRVGVSPQLLVGETSGAGQQQCNPHANSVTTDASGGALGFTLSGHICWIDYDTNSNGVYYLVIPKDRNGNPSGEVRLLGTTTEFTTFTSNGATFTAPISLYFDGPDPTNPNLWYSHANWAGGTTILLLAAHFDSTLTGCNPLWKTWAGGQAYPIYGNNYSAGIPMIGANSCITYVNLTNPTTGQDLRAQIVTAYATYNPGFDLAGFGMGQVIYSNGYFGTCLYPAGAGPTFGDPQIGVCGTFNASGTLTQIYDTFSKYPGRFCFSHGRLYFYGVWHALTCDFTGGTNAGIPLYGPFQTTPTRLNLNGFGSSPSWTTDTSMTTLAPNLPCPTAAQMIAAGTPTAVANSLVTLGSSGNHCVQVETQSEACSITPNTAVIWSGGTKTEAQQFPCPTNSAYSMLQKLQAGDGLMDSATTQFGESFIILIKQIVSPGGICTTGVGNCIIQMWLLRGSGLTTNGIHPPYYTTLTHATSWVAQADQFQIHTCVPITADSTVTHAWTLSVDVLCASHGVNVQGNSTGTNNISFVDTNTFVNLDTALNQNLTSGVIPPWGPGCQYCVTPLFPQYAGATNGFIDGNKIQLYGDGGDIVNPGLRTALFSRAANPQTGTGPEFAIGMGTGGYSLTLVPGKNQTYTLTDPYSVAAPNRKLGPLACWAGHTMLQDVTGLGSSIADTGYQVCRSTQAGECVVGSSAGTTYVSVPAAAGSTQGLVNQHTQNAPACVNPSSALGMFQDVPYGPYTDPDGNHQRLFGQGFSGIGGQWQFTEPKLLPTGDWYLGVVPYKDGFASQIWLFQRPPYLADSPQASRIGYVPIPISKSGVSGDQVRIEFWYQEWNGVNGRADHAYTTSSPTTVNPFLWSFETQSYTSCSTGCTIPVPGISGRLLYYAIHTLNGSEGVGPVGIVAVP